MKIKNLLNELKTIIKKNKFFHVSFVIIVLMLSVSWYISYAYFKTTSSRSLITGKIGDVTQPDYNITYMIENRTSSGAGNGTYYASYQAPEKDYTYQAGQSSCTNGATFTKNEDDTFNITSTGPTKCYFYFNAVNINTSDDINLVLKKERKKLDGSGSGIYTNVTDLSISGLIKTGYMFNSSKSGCSDSSPLEFDLVTKKIKSSAGAANVSCTAYFDVETAATVKFLVSNGTMSNYTHTVSFNGSLNTSFTPNSGFVNTYAVMTCDDGIDGSISGNNISLTKVSNSGICVIGIPNEFPTSGALQTLSISNSGYYKIQTWGAQGGNAGGKGGYAEGEVYLEKGDHLTVAIGGAGTISTSGCGGEGYNGGGCAFTTGGGGGGATSIRLNGNDLNKTLLMAGGGGGKGGDTCAPGGVGGGISGGGHYNNGSCGTQGGGGSQNAGGVAGQNSYTPGLPGSHGKGGNGVDGAYDGGGGGGGWYGGGSGASGSYSSGGGGGSGFCFNHPNINIEISTKHFVKNCQLISGDSLFPSTTGTTETGHSGSGYARITLIRV